MSNDIKERLEQIKYELLINKKQIDSPRYLMVTKKFFDDIKFLISTVEEQQKEIDGLSKAGKFFENGYCQYEEENARLREALEFYADDDNWYEVNDGFGYMPEYLKPIDNDGGEKARQALGVEDE